MTLVAKSDHSTGNSKYCSYVLQSNDLVFTFTAPYSRKCAAAAPSSSEPLPDYDQQQAFEFVCTHGLAARAVGEQWCCANLGLYFVARTSYVCPVASAFAAGACLGGI